ncbi:S8/S53 family peptidase [Hymenobacter tenuis]
MPTPTHLITHETAYYVVGPQQGSPPDGSLTAGTPVVMLDEHSNYCRVQLPDGNAVFVESGALQPVAGDPAAPEGGYPEAIELSYGGKPLQLTKSPRLVGLKLQSSSALKLGSGAEVSLASTPETLGGFTLVDTGQAAPQMETQLDALRAGGQVTQGTHVYHTSDDGVPFVPTGQIYIEFHASASTEQCQQLLDAQHLTIIEARGERTVLVQTTKSSPNPIKAAATLQQSPLVAVAEPDLATPSKILRLQLPADERLVDQWHLRNSGLHFGTALGFKKGADARVIDAWEQSQSLGDIGVIVAIIDDGFDLAHPDLSGDGKIVAPMDFMRRTTSPLPDLIAGNWHGTACAGVAVGSANGVGILGAAPQARLMPVRWGADLSDAQLESWFNYVAAMGAWVVSCSWKAKAAVFPLSTRARTAIANCARQGRSGMGTVVCFAAGNENTDIDDATGATMNGFATHPDVMAIAASTSRDERSDYSNFGALISVCAPSSGAGGWRITTADVQGKYTKSGVVVEAGYSPGAYTNDFGGTSSACPLVAGICAWLFSLHPSVTAQQVRQAIESTARKIGNPTDYNARGHSPKFGYGCVDAASAATALKASATAEATSIAAGKSAS